MIKLDVKINDMITPMLKKQVNEIRKIPEEALKVFVKNTPERKGNAKRNTKLKNKKDIVADYKYAQRLDEGYSQQSPKGMTEPTLEYIEQRYDRIMSGK